MSTTFTVYPGTAELPSFKTIIERSTDELHGFLSSVGVKARPIIHLRIQRGNDDSHVPFSLDSEAQWEEDEYAWFMVGDVRGGSDAYFHNGGVEILQSWEGEFENPQCKRIESRIQRCIATGHGWSFRRSVGEPAVVTVA